MNAADFERLQENLIGHALMQRRLRLRPTFFLAATRSDSHVISLDNASGEVCYERLGREQQLAISAQSSDLLGATGAIT